MLSSHYCSGNLGMIANVSSRIFFYSIQTIEFHSQIHILLCLVHAYSFNNNPPPINIQYELNSKRTNIIFCIRETNLFYITYTIILDCDLQLTDHNLILMLIKDSQKASDPNNSYQTRFKRFLV